MIPQDAIQAVAQKQLARYESEYSATHLTWHDFEAPAREDLEAGWDHIQEALWKANRLLLDEQCCQFGCNGGACESCTCCGAGYCISGVDGVPTPGSPDNPDYGAHGQEVFDNWLEVAAEKNPIAAALKSALED